MFITHINVLMLRNIKSINKNFIMLEVKRLKEHICHVMVFLKNDNDIMNELF